MDFASKTKEAKTHPADLIPRMAPATMNDHSDRGVQLRQLSQLMQTGAQRRLSSPLVIPSPSQRKDREEDKWQSKTSASANVNATSLPDNLKAGIESLSGISMDRVQVHRNSSKPAQLNAHAYAQGNDIHLGPGQDEHLPHEAWHVVQQAQGRVKPTMQMKTGVQVNDDQSLEREADIMSKRATAAQLRNRAESSAKTAVGLAVQRTAVVQLMPVDESDVDHAFVILYNDVERVATLIGSPGGGWYYFRLDGTPITVRGHANILRRVAEPMDLSGSAEEDIDSSSSSSDEGEEDDEMMDISSGSSAPTPSNGYNPAHVSSDRSEFDVDAVAKTNGISRREAIQRIRNGFRVQPRTLRLHYPFGSKTVSRGNPAFRTPDETEKEPQAMVGYRQGDFGKHKKVGKDYDEWADVLSDDEEEETTKRARAKKMADYLEGTDDVDFDDFSARQRAALGGLFSVGLISDPLRTEYNSGRTEDDFMSHLRSRERGETSFHTSFGSKGSSTFLPARSGGSSAQRERLRQIAREEVSGAVALQQNNCLINAICRAAHGRNANMVELMNIRFNLGNLGQMMLATPQTINVIRNVLGINNEIIVRYPTGTPDETFVGIPPQLQIFHTGGLHFQVNCPNPANYAGD